MSPTGLRVLTLVTQQVALFSYIYLFIISVTFTRGNESLGAVLEVL